MVFQDPNDSLNPHMTVRRLIAEPMVLQRTGVNIAERTIDLLRVVGLTPQHATRLPNQLSGGEKQRVAIARAISSHPQLVVCDEPVSSLDVSVRAQILNLLLDLKKELGASFLFISHDLSVVRHVCDRVAVMYAGKIVEVSEAESLFANPQHPYTVALLSAVPVPNPSRSGSRIHIQGEPPDLATPLNGCPFRSRCWKAQSLCTTLEPPLVEHTPGHATACHFPGVNGGDSVAGVTAPPDLDSNFAARAGLQ
jgi:oligopeptide/dipeptide ABC transporter ATP-binding protein